MSTKIKTEHRATIAGMTVSSRHRYIIYGSVRGLVSEHRTEHAAHASLDRDQAGCASQGGYSDAAVYGWDDDCGWSVATEAEEAAE